MPTELLANVVYLAFAGLLVWAAVGDARAMTIPNRIPISIVCLWPAALVVAWPGAAGAGWSIAIATAALLVGFLLFVLRVFGGGDAKLAAAVALWAGPALAADFLIVTALTGGLVALAALVWRMLNRKLVMVPFVPASVHAARETAELPYGVPIAAGGLWVALRLAGI